MISRIEGQLPIYHFDRSRLETAAECPRKYYWMYAFLGIGIVRDRGAKPYFPFLTGSFTHLGVEGVLKGRDGMDAAESAAVAYSAELEPVVRDEAVYGTPEGGILLQAELEQQVDLVRALVYGWSLVGYPKLKQRFEVLPEGIEQEEEIAWELEGKIAKLLTRTDILVQDKGNIKGVYLINLKTVGVVDEKWRLSFDRDMQTLTEAIAVEDRIGIKTEGVIIEGLVKGKRSEYPEGSGLWQHHNPLIWVWYKDSSASNLPGESSGPEFASSWNFQCKAPHKMRNGKLCPGGKDHTLSKGAGWRKRPVREVYPGGIYAWIDWLLENEPETLFSFFVQLEPIARSEYDIERWKRQVLHSEIKRQDAAEDVDALFIDRKHNEAFLLLDYHFPMFSGYQCHNCPYEGICWGGDTPFDEGKWKPRIPNHPSELGKVEDKND